MEGLARLRPDVADRRFRIENEKRRRSLAGIAAGTGVIVTLGLMFPFVFTRSSLPFMSTPTSKVHRALVHALRDEKLNNKAFVDLGSGDGSAVYQALNAGYEKAVGIELNLTLYLWSACRRWFFWSKEHRRRSRFLYQDMFDSNLRGSGTILIFGVRPLMGPISEKLARECAPGTVVLSYRFPLTTAEHAADKKRLHAELISEDQEMMMYRVLGEELPPSKSIHS